MASGAQLFLPVMNKDGSAGVCISADFGDFIEGNIEQKNSGLNLYDGMDLYVEKFQFAPLSPQTIEARFVLSRITVRNTPPTLWEHLKNWWVMRSMWRLGGPDG